MAIDKDKWGILYCPKTGTTNKLKRWNKLQKLLESKKVSYDVIHCESSDSVERLVTMLINNGYKTLVVVGGDSAVNDAVNCLMREEKLLRDEISLGIIPNGVLNDFVRFWGFDEDHDEKTIDALIKHRVRKIDVGSLRYTDMNGEKQHRYFVNCVNIGMIADVMNQRRQTRKVLGSRTLSFVVSLVLMLFHLRSYKMRLIINSETIDRKVMTVCVGNGPGYGQTPNAVPYSGLLDVSVVYTPQVSQLFEGLWLLVTGRFLNHRSVHPYRTREVVVESKKALVGVDGRLLKTPVGEFTIQVEPEIINLLISD